jgi:hypothetical protein
MILVVVLRIVVIETNNGKNVDANSLSIKSNFIEKLKKCIMMYGNHVIEYIAMLAMWHVYICFYIQLS